MATEKEGVDFDIAIEDRASPVVVIAPHGGKIEPGTSEIAVAIAGSDHSTYLFEGKKSRDNHDLHITSAHFNERQAIELLKTADTVIGIHGRKDEIGSQPDPATVVVGGLNFGVRDRLVESLRDAGFKAKADAISYLAGIDPDNICNCGRSGKGVQLEIPASLRRQLVVPENENDLIAFATSIRRVVEEVIGASGVDQK